MYSYTLCHKHVRRYRVYDFGHETHICVHIGTGMRASCFFRVAPNRAVQGKAMPLPAACAAKAVRTRGAPEFGQDLGPARRSKFRFQVPAKIQDTISDPISRIAATPEL